MRASSLLPAEVASGWALCWAFGARAFAALLAAGLGSGGKWAVPVGNGEMGKWEIEAVSGEMGSMKMA